MARLDLLLEMLAKDPNDAFLRYGVAMERVKSGHVTEALAEFDELVRRDPNYVAAYFMAGKAAQGQGNRALAGNYLHSGLEAAKRIGDKHAQSEIGEALQMLEG